MRKIQSAVEFYTQSITTLEGRYHRRQRRDPDLAKPKAEHVTGLVMEDFQADVEFAVDLRRGWERFDETRSWLFSEISKTDRFEARQIMVSDGERHAALMHTFAKCPIPSEVSPAVPTRLNMSSTRTRVMYFRPWEFVGLPLISRGGTLADYMRFGSPRLVGDETIGGATCHRLESPGLTVWIDPRHDFLPRRIQFPSRNQRPRVLDVLEFRRFRDPVQKADRWFPSRGKASWSDQIYEVEVVELTMNPQLDHTRFRIEPRQLPAGVEVNEHSKLKPQRWYTGGPQGERLWRERQHLKERLFAEIQARLGHAPAHLANRGVAAPLDSRIEARPPRSRHWFAWLLASGSVVLIVAGVFRIVRGRRGRV